MDWFQGTFETKYNFYVEENLKRFLGVENFVKQPHSFKWYEEVYEHPTGIKIARGHISKVPGGDGPKSRIDWSQSYLEFSGSTIKYFEQEDFLKFIQSLSEISFKVTHCDLAMDDHHKELDIYKIKKAADNGYHCGFRDAVDFRETGVKGSKGLWIAFGHRGSKGSGKYLKFYDKGKETKGKYDVIRTELCLYGERAIQAYELILKADINTLGRLIVSLINGAIDFRQKKPGETHLERCRRLPFWRFMDKFDKIVPVFNIVEKCLEKVIDWLNYQVAPSFSMVHEYYYRASSGKFDDFNLFFYKFLEEGDSRLTAKHEFLINKQLASDRPP